ncbi:MAG: T9SS type A sorting domain-containing protein [Bacteroidales bacterium]|nr:T9SS type A sorting domain-containing protein [Bacteroidales bacterium]
MASLLAQTSVWDGSQSPFTNGTGTQSDPYLIESAANLAYLASVVNSGTNTQNIYYRTTVNIDLNNLQWIPIGDEGSHFSGNLDGNKHTIANLYINGYSGHGGLFGRINDGSVKNVGIVGNSSIVLTKRSVGAIVGYCTGNVEISNCYNTGSISTYGGSSVGGIVGYYNGEYWEGNTLTISNCYNTGSISTFDGNDSYGGDSHLGGIVGATDGGFLNIINCHNTGTLTSTGGDNWRADHSGGIIAHITSVLTILNCYNTGAIIGEACHEAGGIVGVSGYTNPLTIINCYNTGSVSIAMGGGVGGITGVAHCAETTISNCYNVGAISFIGDPGYYHAGGIVGANDEPTITVTNCHYLNTSANNPGHGTPQTETFMKTPEFVDILGDAFFMDTEFTNQGYPILLDNGSEFTCDGSENPFTNGDGTQYNPYLIESLEHWEYLRCLVNNGVGATNINGKQTVGANTYYKLTKDIDFNSIPWTPIGYYNSESGGYCFGGHVDGNGHTIANLYINSNTLQQAGLFGVMNGGSVKNLGIVRGSSITLEGNNHWGFDHGGAGAIIGFCIGNTEISNCYSNATISANYSGGIVGGMDRNNSTLTINNCHNSGTISANNCAGGIVVNESGNNTLVINNCYNTGSISGGYFTSGIVGGENKGNLTITGCYNAGPVVGDGWLIGGILGKNDHDGILQITNCYNLAAISGDTNGGILGENKGSATISCCFNRGSISNGGRMGGIVGNSESGTLNIINCYNTGSVSGHEAGGIVGILYGGNTLLTITNCYNAGSISPDYFDERSGGIIGYIESPSSPVVINNCHYLNTSTDNPGGGTPQTEQFMKTAAFVNLLGEAFLMDAEYMNEGYPVLECTNVVNITEIGNNNLTLYPNPTTGTVYFETESNVKVYNLQGVLLQETFNNQIDLSGYAQGMYFLQVGDKLFKIVKN